MWTGRSLARGYDADVDVVFELADDLCPWNARRWRLTVSGDDVTCAPTSDEAELELDTRELATAYLGGPSLASLAAAGLVVRATAGGGRRPVARAARGRRTRRAADVLSSAQPSLSGMGGSSPSAS